MADTNDGNDLVRTIDGQKSRQLPRSVNAAFDQGCRRRRPRTSTAAASSVAPIARAPSSPRTGISLKESGAGAVGEPRQVVMRRAGFSATTRKGIKNTSSPAGNVGERERARRRQPLSMLRNLRSLSITR